MTVRLSLAGFHLTLGRDEPPAPARTRRRPTPEPTAATSKRHQAQLDLLSAHRRLTTLHFRG